MNPTKVILKNVQFEVHLSLDHFQREAALKAINLSVLGRPNCNILNENNQIVRDPSIDNETENYLGDSHYCIKGGKIVRIEFDVTEDGSFVNYRFPAKKRKFKEVTIKA